VLTTVMIELAFITLSHDVCVQARRDRSVRLSVADRAAFADPPHRLRRDQRNRDVPLGRRQFRPALAPLPHCSRVGARMTGPTGSDDPLNAKSSGTDSSVQLICVCALKGVTLEQ